MYIPSAGLNALSQNGQIGSSIYYECALNSFVKFKGENIKFADVTVDWLNRYEAFMLKDGKTYATIAMYMRALRTTLNGTKEMTKRDFASNNTANSHKTESFGSFPTAGSYTINNTDTGTGMNDEQLCSRFWFTLA